MKGKITQREVEALSAYIDGQLSQNERTRLEQELQGRADLRALLEDMQRTHQALASQPVMRAPRNFTLTPKMVGMRPSRPAIGRLAPAMSFASVVAAVLFIMALAGDLLSSRSLLPLGQVSSQPVSMAVEKEAPAAAEMESLETGLQDSAAPPAAAPAEAAPMVETQMVEATPTPEASFLAEAYPALGASPTDGVKSAREVSATGLPPALAMQMTPTAQTESQPTAEPTHTERPPTAEPTHTVSPPTARSTQTVSLAIVEPTQVAAAQADLTGAEPAQPPAEQENQVVPPGRSGWLWLEVSLALLAVLLGAMAYLMHRSRRA